MLPYPWLTLADVVVVMVGTEPMVLLSHFHSQVLHADGPMPMTVDFLRSKLEKVTAGSQLLMEQKGQPSLMGKLKAQGIVPIRVSKVKLVSLEAMEAALLLSGCQEDHVAIIMATHKRVVPQLSPAVPRLQHPGSQQHVGSTAAAQGAGSRSALQLPADQRGQPAVPTTLPSSPGGPAVHSSSLQQPPDTPLASDFGHHRGLQQLGQYFSNMDSCHSHGMSSQHAKSGLKRPAEGPSHCDTFYAAARDWPVAIPELAWPPKALQQDYGLHTMLPSYSEDASIPLGQEVEEFRAWCTQPMHLGRGLQYANPVRSITFERDLECVHGFIGFMFKVGLLVMGSPVHSRACVCVVLYQHSSAACSVGPTLMYDEHCSWHHACC